MKIKEQTSSRMVITRGSGFDRSLFSIFLIAGVAVAVFYNKIDPPGWPWALLGVAFFAAGAYFWLLSGDMTLTLDRRSRLAQLDWQHLRGRKSERVPLADIIELRVEESDEADRLVFVLKDGTTLPLTPYSYTGGAHPKVRSAINAWLAETG